MFKQQKQNQRKIRNNTNPLSQKCSDGLRNKGGCKEVERGAQEGSQRNLGGPPTG